MVGGTVRPEISYLICATPRSGSTFLCEALDNTGIAGHPAEHFEVLLETGQPRQPRDYFQRSNDPEVWALLDDPEFQDVLGEPSPGCSTAVLSRRTICIAKTSAAIQIAAITA